MDKSKWIAIGEAAKYVGVSRDTLRRWEKAGKIKAFRSPTNRRYYTREQLDQLISKKSEEKEASAVPSKGPRRGEKSLKLVGFVFLGLLIALLVALPVIFFLSR